MFLEVFELNETLLEAKHIEKHFPLRRGFLTRFSRREALKVRAVSDISLSVGVNETLGLVGESGSGKTTLGRVVLMLESPTSGQVFLRGREITNLRGEELRQIRKRMQIVFQNPDASLDPRQRVVDIISEPLRAFKESKDQHVEDSVLNALRGSVYLKIVL